MLEIQKNQVYKVVLPLSSQTPRAFFLSTRFCLNKHSQIIQHTLIEIVQVLAVEAQRYSTSMITLFSSRIELA